MKLVIGIILATTLAIAQGLPSDWSNVIQLNAGKPIRVATADGKSMRGEFRSATQDTLVLTTSNHEETLTRAQVAKVAIRKPGHRGRNTLIGLGIGAGTGLAIGAGLDQDEGFLRIGKAVFTPLGGIIGAIIGAVIPTGGWHTVFRK